MKNQKKILGIDPGLASVGWAVLTPNCPRLVASGCFQTAKVTLFCDRLAEIYTAIQNLTEKYDLGVLAIEELFFAKNVRTAIKVAQCLGVIKLAGRQLGLEVVEYTPLNVKMTITGYGRAEKSQVQFMIAQTLGLRNHTIKPDHAADAAAVALTHIFTNKKIK